jgi:hypothetical protein
MDSTEGVSTMMPRSLHTCRAALVSALTLLSLACAQGERTRDQPLPSGGPDPSTPPPPLEAFGSGTVDLSPWFPGDSQLVGVAVGARGERYILDQKTGLLRLGADGTGELVLDTGNLERRYGLSPGLVWTDVVGYGEDRFLITAENDGFLLDLWAGTFNSYFCYFPATDVGSLEPPMSISQELDRQGIPVAQRTNSVAFNRDTGDIFAQPQTLRLDRASDGVAGSELFVFSSTGGQPVLVQPLSDLGFSAGGMVADRSRLILGFGNALYQIAGDVPEVVFQLEDDVVVTGLALTDDRSLLVLDGPSRRLLQLELAEGPDSF